jgi:hypothetical protein
MAKGVVDASSSQDEAQGTERLTAVLAGVVARVRGAIRKGGHTPVSLTASSVPPEAVQHVWTLALSALSLTTPDLARYTETDAFKAARTAAEDWLKDVSDRKDGAETDYPSDPDTTTVRRTVIVEPNEDSDILTRTQLEGF